MGVFGVWCGKYAKYLAFGTFTTPAVEALRKKKKKKTSSNQVGELEGGKRQVTKPKILFITLFMSLFALFI